MFKESELAGARSTVPAAAMARVRNLIRGTGWVLRAAGVRQSRPAEDLGKVGHCALRDKIDAASARAAIFRILH